MNIWVPLWKYRTERIEKWLSRMAAQGQRLVRISKWGIFRFRSGEPRTITYGIGFNPVKGNPPPALLEHGWKPEILHRYWYIASNTLTQEAMFYLNRLSLIFQVSLCLLLFPLWVLAALTQWQLIRPELPPWIWSILFCLTLLYITSCMIFFLVSRGRHKLILEHEAPDTSIIKRRFGWTASPDKLEQWLEAMEARGYHLHRVQRNKFYYTKGSPRKVKYCVDYQLMVDQWYYGLHTEAGWAPVYTGHNLFGNWTIWAQEYQDSLPPPLHDSKSQRHSILRVALTTTLMAGIYLPWSLTLAKLEVDTLTKHGVIPFSLGLLAIYGYVLLLSYWHTVRTWLYYLRLVKK